MPTTGRRLAVLIAFGCAAAAAAQDAPPPNYVAGFAGTTLCYRPPGGPTDGFQHDATLLLGYGRYVTPSLALELDMGPTLVRGSYSSFSLVPGLVWAFHPNAYAAARFVVPVDPEWNLALFPGIGLSKTFRNRITPILELNVFSYVGRGDPDFGIALTAGVLVSF